LRLIPKRTTKKNLTAATNVIPIVRHPKFQPSKEREYTDEELCAFAEGIAKYGRFYFADDEDISGRLMMEEDEGPRAS